MTNDLLRARSLTTGIVVVPFQVKKTPSGFNLANLNLHRDYDCNHDQHVFSQCFFVFFSPCFFTMSPPRHPLSHCANMYGGPDLNTESSTCHTIDALAATAAAGALIAWRGDDVDPSPYERRNNRHMATIAMLVSRRVGRVA